VYQFGASKVSEKLKWIVNGYFSDVQKDPEFWDSGIAITDYTRVLLNPTLDTGLPPYPW